MTTAEAAGRPGGVVVFVGTSLPHEETRALLPSARVLPPIARGDLPRVVDEGATVVAIIDGVFHQKYPVAPFEIRDALAKGVRIFGAASMGALRAAEMRHFGMIGVGTVFEWYRDGVLMRDDAVALQFDPDTFKNLTVPLVNVRWALQRAGEEGLLPVESAQAVLAVAEEFFFRDLTWPRLLAKAETALPPGSDRAALVRALSAWDLKREDALRCVEAVAALLREAGG